MYAETKPILFNCPKEQESIEIYPVHDLHYGSDCFNLSRWNRLHDLILSADEGKVLKIVNGVPTWVTP